MSSICYAKVIELFPELNLQSGHHFEFHTLANVHFGRSRCPLYFPKNGKSWRKSIRHCLGLMIRRLMKNLQRKIWRRWCQLSNRWLNQNQLYVIEWILWRTFHVAYTLRTRLNSRTVWALSLVFRLFCGTVRIRRVFLSPVQAALISVHPRRISRCVNRFLNDQGWIYTESSMKKPSIHWVQFRVIFPTGR